MKPLLQVVAPIGLEKRAYSIQLGKDANEWPVSILQEAYKQIPYLRNYEVDVALDRTDESRGYGVGKMVVYPHRMEKNAAIDSDRAVSFPIIIRQHEMSPLDVVSHKDMILPASENYVAEKLFQPALAHSKAKPGQFSRTDLASQIDPPTQRSNMSIGMRKQSSVNLLEAVLPTLTGKQIKSFHSDLQKNASLKHSVSNNPAFGEAVRKVVQTKEKTASESRGERNSSLKPTTVQFKKLGTSYFVKTANHSSFSPVQEKISRFEAQEYLSSSDFSSLCNNSSVTFTMSPNHTSPELIKEASSASRVGIYSTMSNNDVVEGVVIPKMISLEGLTMPSQMFISKTASAMQESIAGMYTQQVILPSNPIRGKGVFTFQEGNRGVATEPITIRNEVTFMEDKEKLAYYIAVRDTTGEDIKVTIVPGINKIASLGVNHFAIPDSMGFVSIPKATMKVCATVDDFKEREMLKKASSLRIVSDGNVFQISGSEVFPEMMDKVDTAFALSAYGYSSGQINSLMEKSASAGYANLYNVRSINVVGSDYLPAKEKPYGNMDLSSITVDLTKEASTIIEKETVDSILALRFLTPENVGIYVNYLPELEKSASKVAEILIAARLGMDDVKEVAAKNTLSQLSTVIEGLKSLQSKIL